MVGTDENYEHYDKTTLEPVFSMQNNSTMFLQCEKTMRLNYFFITTVKCFEGEQFVGVLV